MMSCSKWIAEEIEKPGVENSPCWESHLVQWIVEESHVLFKWIADETIVEETLLAEEESCVVQNG
jgi:hypothetical protein